MEARILSIINEIIRVNYIGEIGANRIYSGQANVIKDSTQKEVLERNLSEEMVHLDYFESMGKKIGIRPSVFNFFWDKCSYGIGLITGIMGFKHCMACTEGVEDVIIQHYERQLIELNELISLCDVENKYYNILIELRNKIKIFMNDESLHKNNAENYLSGKHDEIFVSKLSSLVSRFAIAISKKF